MSFPARVLGRRTAQYHPARETLVAIGCKSLRPFSRWLGQRKYLPLSRSTHPFSTMAALKVTGADNNPRPKVQREFDPEIKDIADYVHNYTIDSDLAVSHAHGQYLSSN